MEATCTLLCFPGDITVLQRDNRFFPVWAYVLPTTMVRLPVSFLETLLWTVLTYFEVDLAPSAGAFFMYWLILFLLHAMAVTLFRTVGHLSRNIVVANAVGSLSLLAIMMLGGFVLTKEQIHPWWVSPSSHVLLCSSAPAARQKCCAWVYAASRLLTCGPFSQSPHGQHVLHYTLIMPAGDCHC